MWSLYIVVIAKNRQNHAYEADKPTFIFQSLNMMGFIKNHANVYGL